MDYRFRGHDDTKQPHVHVVLNLMNGQGKRLHTSVAEVQRWRERFAEIAREHGIDVDATRAGWRKGSGSSPTACWLRPRASDNEPRRQMLERAATLLRVLANETQPTPTRAQQVASQMQRKPTQNKAADSDRER